MGKRGGQGSFGYHVQHPPRDDKFDPNWKPRRGGKKARKQKELSERRYKEWFESKGVPPIVPEEIEEIQSDDSGPPDSSISFTRPFMCYNPTSFWFFWVLWTIPALDADGHAHAQRNSLDLLISSGTVWSADLSCCDHRAVYVADGFKRFLAGGNAFAALNPSFLTRSIPTAGGRFIQHNFRCWTYLAKSATAKGAHAAWS